MAEKDIYEENVQLLMMGSYKGLANMTFCTRDMLENVKTTSFRNELVERLRYLTAKEHEIIATMHDFALFNNGEENPDVKKLHSFLEGAIKYKKDAEEEEKKQHELVRKYWAYIKAKDKLKEKLVDVIWGEDPEDEKY